MTRSSHPVLRAAVLASALLLALPAVGGPPVLVVQAPASEAPLAVVYAQGEARLVGPGQISAPLELPAGGGIDVLAEVRGGWIGAGSRGDGKTSDLLLLRSRGGAPVELPPPPGREAPRRGSPRLLVTAEELVGVVWLEGSRQEDLTVRAAEWLGGGWGPPELVSPPGPGAQLAPAATVLEDGSWLVVWAAVDGQDDEILWSRRGPQGWSAPRQLGPANAVPDITPTAAALPDGGALVVWSFYADRHYRLRSARYDGERWEVSEPFGDDGSHRPELLRRGLTDYLFYRAAWPSAWWLVELDAAGGAVRRAAAASEDASRPLVDLSDPGQPLLLWPAASPEEPPVTAAPAWGGQP